MLWAQYSDPRWVELAWNVAPYWWWDQGQRTQRNGLVTSIPKVRDGHVRAQLMRDDLRRPVSLFGGFPYGRYRGEAPDLQHYGTFAYLHRLAAQHQIDTRSMRPHELIDNIVARGVDACVVLHNHKQSNHKQSNHKQSNPTSR